MPFSKSRVTGTYRASNYLYRTLYLPEYALVGNITVKTQILGVKCHCARDFCNNPYRLAELNTLIPTENCTEDEMDRDTAGSSEGVTERGILTTGSLSVEDSTIYMFPMNKHATEANKFTTESSAEPQFVLAEKLIIMYIVGFEIVKCV